MVLVFLPWLLRGHDRPEYALQQVDSTASGVSLQAGASARLLLVIVAARFTFNALLRGPATRLAQRRATANGHTDGGRLLEELWVTVGNSVMLAAAMFVMLKRNGGCWFFDTSSCLSGWPNHSITPAAQLYYNLELAWYLHMLLKPVLKYGLPDGRDMLIHHFASLALILVSYGANLTRIGVVVLACFAISNPLLHLAKICNQLSLGPLKIGGFLLFALVFFLSRVLLVPLAILKPAMLDSRRDLPYGVEDFHAFYLFFNALLGTLYLMQLMWMRGILRVLRSAIRHGSDAASRTSAQIDPAKRYAVAGEVARQQQSGDVSPAGVANGNDKAAAGVVNGFDSAATLSQRHQGKQQQQPQQNGGVQSLPHTPSPADLPALSAAKLAPAGAWPAGIDGKTQ